MHLDAILAVLALSAGHVSASIFGGPALNASCRSVVYKGPMGSSLDAFRQAKTAFALEDLCFVEEIVPKLLSSPRLLYYPKHDASSPRTCLLPGLPPPQVFTEGPVTPDAIVAFVNRHAHTFRALDGSLQPIAATVNALESNRFTVPRSTSDRSCKVVDASEMTTARFQDHVLRNEPLIIRNAATSAMQSPAWSTERLLERIGRNDVHVKVSPTGDFEGCEPLAWWSAADDVAIPDFVASHLESPDRVLVRPAAANMPFAAFVDKLRRATNSSTSYYLEYLSLTTYVPELLADIPSYAWADFLKLEVQNLWFGDGKSVGKLHFDAYENIMVMVAGSKEFVLIDPSDNRRLYEGHIREAQYDIDDDGVFHRTRLLQSTSMVNSPVDMNNPSDMRKYPRFQDTTPLRCIIHEGDALFLPSFWWHEVKSSPAVNEPRNVAVNFWYTPVYQRGFPCPTCALTFNTHAYASLLSRAPAKDEL
ncbi:hypothetical protein SPRG_11948 [Saprolegnia parasitica CBS 223.65]|uniref:JmjC domain-containing protein n=1 Tax=Saprolegnia parasitica (strain CBS 223.65) TaxID=695850 RepID=A0A067BX56_SAPPC|nr:hypothetical protein SPRG_11948 [Saprolegnia parasitica CBS 223.65]KDO23104.1 hypothetical protein SPRG_11948 [Saprolegnia parasitica CBS 223.65]|eukprot:XP_012206215.1 hypothetical protein SPRG_11948 [Saprolegnia parasitica CBS 223.65]